VNYCFNYLIIMSYKIGMINRKKFMSLWETVQALSDERICGENGTSNIR
jgi:hypothetical protein